jgi:hypothetical protein
MRIVITESQYKILEMNTSIKRRYNKIKDFLFNLMDGMYVCDYDNIEHFMEGILYNAEDYFTDFNDFDGMDKDDFLELLGNEFIDEINSYYNRHCSEESVNEDLGRWFKEKWVDVSKKVKGKHPLVEERMPMESHIQNVVHQKKFHLKLQKLHHHTIRKIKRK